MVYVMLTDGFEEIEALAFVDILRRGEVEVKTVSVENTDTVTGAHNIAVKPDICLDEVCNDYQAIVLPGGMPGTLNLQKSCKLEHILKDAYANNKMIGAICAAPMIIGQLGMLESKEATCYPSFEKYLNGAMVTKKRVCVSNNIITSCGAGTAHDFAFSFLEILKGKDIAEKIRSSMLYDR